MTVDDLDIPTLVARYGAGVKLKREIMRLIRWRHHDSGPPRDDWYREWPMLSLRIEAALRSRR